jgi:hypothetical protein
VEPLNEPHAMLSPPAAQFPDLAAEPAYSDDGIDLTLIRWMLSLTPMERLRVLESTVASILSLRHARGADGLS